MRASALLACLLSAAPLLAGPPADRETLAAHSTRVAPGGPVAGLVRPVTFANQVARLLQAKCQSCHHEGDIAPFPLVTYDDAYQHRAKLQYMVDTRQMPPWHVDSKCADFARNPSLTDDEIKLVDQWVLAGAPEGDPAAMPAPLTFRKGGRWASPTSC